MNTLLSNPHTQIDLFRNLLNGLVPTQDEAVTIAPAYQWNETNEEYQLAVDLPGVEKQGIELTRTEDALQLKAERTHPFTKDKSAFTYQRSFYIPEGLPEQNIQAKLENGVLRINLKKPAPVPTKLIEVA